MTNVNYPHMIEQLSGIIQSLAQTELMSRFQAGLMFSANAPDAKSNDAKTDDANARGTNAWRIKGDGSLVTDADKAMQHGLQAALAQQWPHISFVGEEMDDAEQRRILASLTANGSSDSPAKAYWCLDPLDGTTNFAAGIPFFSVSLALIENGQVALGVVYDPIRRECFSAYRGSGVYLNGVPLAQEATGQESGPALSELIAVVDLKRLPAPLAQQIATQHPFRSQRNFGSSALEWCWLATGRFQLYLHGGQKLWDYAAGRLILDAASGVVSTIEGQRTFEISLDAQSVVAATNLQLYQCWYDWVAANKN